MSTQKKIGGEPFPENKAIQDMKTIYGPSKNNPPNRKQFMQLPKPMSLSNKELLLRQELAPGVKVRLDVGFSNSSIVEVVNQTPHRLYTTVKDGDVNWQVMTYRLTKITK